LRFKPTFEGNLEALLFQRELGEVVFANQSDELLDVFKFQGEASVWEIFSGRRVGREEGQGQGGGWG
jgi:hypothetical protein